MLVLCSRLVCSLNSVDHTFLHKCMVSIAPTDPDPCTPRPEGYSGRYLRGGRTGSTEIPVPGIEVLRRPVLSECSSIRCCLGRFSEFGEGIARLLPSAASSLRRERVQVPGRFRVRPFGGRTRQSAGGLLPSVSLASVERTPCCQIEVKHPSIFVLLVRFLLLANLCVPEHALHCKGPVPFDGQRSRDPLRSGHRVTAFLLVVRTLDG